MCMHGVRADVALRPAAQELREVNERLGLQVTSLGDFIEVRAAAAPPPGSKLPAASSLVITRGRLCRLQVLNQQNYLLKKGNQMYQLQTSCYSQSGLGRRHQSSQSQGMFRR